MRKTMKINYILMSVILCLLAACAPQNTFKSNWVENIERPWLGKDYWANPLQDWQLKNGRIECIVGGGDRNVFLLTRELNNELGDIEMSVTLGRMPGDENPLDEGWVGFRTGIRGEFDDYRDSAVRGAGFPLGITTDGRLFIGSPDSTTAPIGQPLKTVQLEMKAAPEGNAYRIELTARDSAGKVIGQNMKTGIAADWLHGGVALVCSRGKQKNMPDKRGTIEYGQWGGRPGTARGGNVRFWFDDWKLAGSKVVAFPERALGPIMFSQYTLNKGTLKLTAQMAPLSLKDGKTVELQTLQGSNWTTIAESQIDAMARTALFQVENWDESVDTPYRLTCTPAEGYLATREGTIRKVPWDKKELVVAGFTGNNDLGFPNNELVDAVVFHDPDMLFFSGDQLYEGVGGYGVQRKPVGPATLDYLRKWYIYGWAYGDLMRDRPTVAITDDHDVYHGNIWGAGGIATPPGKVGAAAQDAGGYKMPAEWVKMVERTQTSHLPAPWDPTPVAQGIGVYYSALNYAGVSFAILEDRKFKSAPKALLPKAQVHNGWAQNRAFDEARNGDVPGAVLLGDRQLNFLDAWAADWADKTWMKVVLSQTIFANVATLPRKDSFHDKIVPSLRIVEPGEYPPDDVPVSDMDSNGWPQTGRNKALRAMRKGFSFHIAGDQHLGSTIQYGIDAWRDAGFAFCVPAISNVWPRRWFPAAAGKNRRPGSPRYAGDFKDGFGNKMSVHAASNPHFTGKKPSRLYDRATGYGIVKFNRATRKITMECWPRWVDPSQPDAKQYPAWPIVIDQMENYGRKAVANLPELKISGMADPVVQIIDEKGTVIYTVRIKGNSFQPKVFAAGKYTIKVGEPGTAQMKTLSGVQSVKTGEEKEIMVTF